MLNIEDTVDGDLGASKAAKDGSNITNAATWRAALSVPSISESLDRAFAPAGGLQFSKAVAGTRLTSTLSGQDLGTQSATLWISCRIPSGITADTGLIGVSSSATLLKDTARGMALYITAAGALRGILFGATGSDYRRVDLANFYSTYVGLKVDLLLTRDAITGAIALYINGILQTVVETTGGTPPAWGDTITSTYSHVGIYAAADIFTGRVYGARVGNFAATASDASDLALYGVAIRFATGSVVNKFSGDSANFGGGTVGTWTGAAGGSVAVVSNKLRLTQTSAGGMLSSQVVPVAGRLYRVRFTHQLISGSVVIISLRGGNQGTLTKRDGTSAAFTATGSLATYDFELVADPSVSGQIYFTHSSGSGAVVEFDNFECYALGWICDLDCAIGVGTLIPDLSDNCLAGDLFGGITHIVPRVSGRVNLPRRYDHSAISATAATTKHCDLPPYCRVVHEIDEVIAAFDSGITCDTGISGTPAKFVSAQALQTPGIFTLTSADVTILSASVSTAIYAKKSGATTQGVLKKTLVVEIHGGTPR